jgi:succinylglutamate desuccinylase
VQAELARRELFAAVDLHNNTGHNPHYSVVTDLDVANLGLAWLFDDQAVYIREPDTVLTRTFTGRCPAVALELGPIGDPRCADRGFDFLARLLAVAELPEPDLGALRLYRTEARVHIPDGVDFSFAGDGHDTPLVLTGGIEGVNFHELPAGTEFAATALPPARALRVLDTDRAETAGRYFESDGRYLRLRRSVIPAMYTTDPVVVRQDCLCYFMTRMRLDDLTG